MSINTNPETSKGNDAPGGSPTSHTGVNGQMPPETVGMADTGESAIPITKPGAFDATRFKSKKGKKGAGVGTLQMALPHHKIADAKDFVRLHPHEATHWSDELCFVNVPIKGQKRDLLHLIDEDLVPPEMIDQVQRFSLAIATKPHDVFFLCHVPTQNLDNSWNQSALQGCEIAKTTWIKVTSKKEEGADTYTLTAAKHPDAFPDPKWPQQSIYELIGITFGKDRSIDRENHPALLRLIGAKQSVV
jgi:hypothetical protein